jgi:hypothetical protein
VALLVCTESFTRWRNGIPSTVAAGDVIDDKDWRVQGKARDGSSIASLWCEPAEATAERQNEPVKLTPAQKKAADKEAAKAADDEG